MQESIKNKVNFLLLALCVLFFVTTLFSFASLMRCGKAKDKETVSRFDVEEKLNQLASEKSGLEDKLNMAKEELNKEKSAHEETSSALQEEQMLNKSLRENLDKLTGVTAK